jgi:integrase
MLNDTKCRNAKPGEKPYKLSDAKGLYLEVKPNGVRAWRYRFELGGKESVYAIGDYPVIGLAEARRLRQEARALVKEGINPAHQRRLARIKVEQAHATTFEAVTGEWLSLKDWEEVTKAKRLAMLKRVVFPRIGGLPIGQVSPAHVLEILTRTAKIAPTVAAEAKRTMSGIFDFAVSTLRAEANPVLPVRRALPANKTQHKRPLSAEEIGALMRDLGAYPGHFQTVCGFRLMWFTLCRPREVIEAQWSEFDLDGALWRIPAARMKKRKEHVVPLPRQAVELLRTLHGVTGQRVHVFPNRDNRNGPMTDNALRQALKNMGWAGRYSPHATRTTGSTRLNEMGYPADWIERQLAHIEPNAVRRTYNHADYFADRRTMMQAWADLLDAWREGAKVIPLKQAVA